MLLGVIIDLYKPGIGQFEILSVLGMTFVAIGYGAVLLRRRLVLCYS